MEIQDPTGKLFYGIDSNNVFQGGLFSGPGQRTPDAQERLALHRYEQCSVLGCAAQIKQIDPLYYQKPIEVFGLHPLLQALNTILDFIFRNSEDVHFV